MKIIWEIDQSSPIILEEKTMEWVSHMEWVVQSTEQATEMRNPPIQGNVTVFRQINKHTFGILN